MDRHAPDVKASASSWSWLAAKKRQLLARAALEAAQKVDTRPSNTLTSYHSARRHIWDGDLVAFRRNGLISWVGRGIHSHVGMAVWRPDDNGGTLCIAEFRELAGARVVSFKSQVRKFPGLIDVYRPVFPDGSHLQIAQRAATIMFRQCISGLGYDYGGVATLAVMHLPVVSFVASRYFGFGYEQGFKPASWQCPKFCSFGFDWAYRRAIEELQFDTDWAPVRGLDSRIVEPADLVRGEFRQVHSRIYLPGSYQVVG
jgi:hypothetical protein